MLTDADLPIPSTKARVVCVLLVAFWWVLIMDYTLVAALVFTVFAGLVFLVHVVVSYYWDFPPPTHFEFLVVGSAVFSGVIQSVVAGVVL